MFAFSCRKVGGVLNEMPTLGLQFFHDSGGYGVILGALVTTLLYGDEAVVDVVELLHLIHVGADVDCEA